MNSPLKRVTRVAALILAIALLVGCSASQQESAGVTVSQGKANEMPVEQAERAALVEGEADSADEGDYEAVEEVADSAEDMRALAQAPRAETFAGDSAVAGAPAKQEGAAEMGGMVPGLRLDPDAAAQPPQRSGDGRDLPPREPRYPRREPRPDERRWSSRPADMYFQDYGVNPWEDALDDNESTFALDVDTGSYTIARSYLLDGNRPPPESVRAEEFVNYFEQGYEAPRRGAFAIHVDGAPSPFGDEGEKLIRVGLQARDVGWSERKDAVLTFVVDVSGSMDQGGRLELVKDSLEALVDELDPDDEVSIVAYTNDAWVVLEPTSAGERRKIRAAIRELYPMDSTNAEAGLMLGYELAEEAYRGDAINRVILCSDGVANVGATGPDWILERIGRSVDRGITLTSIGVGMGNYNDVLLERLANEGDGAYFYVDDMAEAEKVFVDDLTGTLQVVARDAKAQVEFNPEVVDFYRLIGYENREVRDSQFRNDRVDAGEVGAGQSVTALYAVHLRPGTDGEIGTVHVRYQDPDEGNVREIDQVFHTDDLERRFSRADAHFRLTASAAAFAEILRDSYYNRLTTLDEVIEVAEDAADDLRGDESAQELVELMERAEGRSRSYDR